MERKNARVLAVLIFRSSSLSFADNNSACYSFCETVNVPNTRGFTSRERHDQIVAFESDGRWANNYSKRRPNRQHQLV